MAKKKLTKAVKTKIETEWYKLPFDGYAGEALRYLKKTRALHMERARSIQDEKKKEHARLARQAKYYEKHPIYIGKTKVVVGSNTYHELVDMSREMQRNMRTVVKIVNESRLYEYKEKHFTEHYSKMMAMASKDKGAKFYVNGKKVSRKKANKMISQLYENVSAVGFGAMGVMKETFDGRYFIDIPEILLTDEPISKAELEAWYEAFQNGEIDQDIDDFILIASI